MGANRIVGLVLVTGLLALGCSSEGSSGRYAGVERWKCFQFGETSCECAGLTPGRGFEAGGSNVTEVTACPATLSVCQSWTEDGDWSCECRAEAFTPLVLSPPMNLENTESCPP